MTAAHLLAVRASFIMRLAILVGCSVAGAYAFDCPAAKLTGRVTDSSGAVIPGVEVKADVVSCKCECCNDPNKCDCCVNQVVTTGDNGSFSIQIGAGSYRVRANVSGFKTYETDVSLEKGETVTLKIKLQD